MLRDRESLTILIFLTAVLIFTGLIFFQIQGGSSEARSISATEDPAKTPGHFSIRTVTPEGLPLSGVEITLTDKNVQLRKSTDADGRARFSDIRVQHFILTAKAEGFTEKSAWFMSGSSEILTLEPDITKHEVILRLHGSNTIGAKYAPDLAVGYLEKLGAENIRTEKGNSPEEQEVSGMLAGKRLTVEIKAHGSSTGFASLKDGSCDIGMSSREIRDREILALQHLGDMKAVASEHVVGLDGIAIITHPANSLETLSVDAIADIFEGRIRRWEETGSRLNGGIEVYARDDKSGTYDTFKGLVLDKRKLHEGARRFESNALLSDSVTRDINGIGFTGLPYVNRAKALAVGTEAGGAIFPTFFTVATEDYPLSRRLYLYTAAAPANPHVLDFIHYALSDEGQKKAADTGFVDLSIKTFAGLVPPGDATTQISPPVEAYAKAVQGGLRLSLNFRFRSNVFELDSRGMRDLQRVIAFLEKPENHGREVLLAGFADSHGAYAYNQELSLKRAQVVADALKARGVYTVEALGVGQELPVASNETPSGRARNRRVEIWVR
ncbi:phosphate transport system substrate-binding protein [Desulfobotulus alkaliphilus]|uniref:Phosphate transport system substrate-binding protein n=2 Tax=Desulfobotulus alkaliphilus TaxID=622671 RepID=A0A562RZU3_9BACT|nr:phosphate transport system substrate-binding protein [Desulfobotulus alkaliphilus]